MNERNGIIEQIENSKLKSGVLDSKTVQSVINDILWKQTSDSNKKAQRDTDAPLLK
jgi:hypothetical protein